MTETEAVHTGKILLLLNFLICSSVIKIIFLQHIIIPMLYPFFFRYCFQTNGKPRTDCHFEVEKLLSKSTTLGENLLLQLWQSLSMEWGTGSVGILPKDFIQKLLTKVWFIENHSSIIHIIISYFNPFFSVQTSFS